MEDREEVKVVVFGGLVRQNQEGKTEILLQKRQGTGYMDGYWDFSASGHVKKREPFAEAICRELQEEIGVFVPKHALKHIYLNQQLGSGYVQVFFITSFWEGTPKIMEPDKCAELEWFEIDHLPDKTLDYVENAIKALDDDAKTLGYTD